ncbi:MAG: hypothetical protein IH585_16995, partial [Anaerolineaceae bacterium]|nr:hypothetical protein [Anaerolineaceae bacterium]
MKNKDFVIIMHTLMIVLIILIGTSGCNTGNVITKEAKNLCEDSDGLVHEVPSTIEGEESSTGLQPSAPALTFRKVTYKRFSRWGEMFLLPDFIRSRTNANTIVCISESRHQVSTYKSGAKAYQIIWTVQLIGYPDGKIFTSKEFQSTYDPPSFKSGFSDIYSDPPDEGQVSTWILSELKRKSAIVSDRSIRDIALSPDGETLVIADGENLQIWDVETETLIHRIEEVNTEKVTFSQDGKFLAGASLEIVHLFDTNNYENISSFEEQGSEILALDFSPDSKLLATG